MSYQRLADWAYLIASERQIRRAIRETGSAEPERLDILRDALAKRFQ